MRKTIICITSLFVSIALGAAPPGESPIDQTKNVLIGTEHLALSFEKLSQMSDDKSKKVVVVHFGDSHIQGDHFSGMIRRNFQGAFGNGGEGILFPYSLCKSFGPKSLTSTSTGSWSWVTVLKNPANENVGVTGYTLITQDTSATVSFSYISEETQATVFDAEIWYGGTNASLSTTTPGMKIEIDTTAYGTGLRRAVVKNYSRGQKLTLRFRKKNKQGNFSANFYGIAFSDTTGGGLSYNRCGVVGATFLQLIAHEDFTVQHLKAVKPDLIFFSYGSNESYNAGMEMKKYSGSVDGFISRLKTEFPEAGIVITSPPDTRSGGRFPVNTQAITDSFRVICERRKCAFWDMHAVMGGDASINFWLSNGLARKDKLHFTKSGYELQGNLFSSAFLESYSATYSEGDLIWRDIVDFAIEEQLAKLKSAATGAPITSGSEKTHTVAKGETLSSIARANSVTVDQLCEWNNIKKTDVLKIGQKIKVKK